MILISMPMLFHFGYESLINNMEYMTDNRTKLLTFFTNTIANYAKQQHATLYIKR